jgi:hypothetical protein
MPEEMESISESKKDHWTGAGMESCKTWNPSKCILLYLQEYNARRQKIYCCKWAIHST